MAAEIEATFLNIDKDKTRKQLQKLGATLKVPETLMQRTVFDLGKNQFARVRDEGNKITLSYKHVEELSLSGTQEICVEVSNYKDTVELLKACGIKAKAEQETLRETWVIDGIEIDIDTWPWLPTFLEIEGPSEQSVLDTAQKLGLNMADAVYGSVDEVYKIYYNVTNDQINLCPIIKFIEKPQWLAKSVRSEYKDAGF